jgi:hypothetical protein
MFNYRYCPFAPLFALRSADEKNSLQLSVRTHCRNASLPETRTLVSSVIVLLDIARLEIDQTCPTTDCTVSHRSLQKRSLFCPARLAYPKSF